MAAAPGLSILEIKMTGDEFVVLQNNTGADITDLGSYALYYFSNYSPLASGVSSSLSFLPATTLPAGESLLLSSKPRATCGAAVAGDLSISLGDSSGFLEVVHLSQNADNTVTQTPGDVVSWDAKANGIIQNVPSGSKDPAAMYYRYQNGTPYGAWQYADINSSNACQLTALMTNGGGTVGLSADGELQSSDGDVVPGTIVSLATTTGASGPYLPAADAGLKAPKLSELLPDPASPATDADDEFIELYNPNDAVFDLSGFILQIGSTTSDTRHNYVLPAGTTIAAKSFKAFYSKDTHLSLSNTGGEAWLLDPFGTSIAQSDPYSTPKQGAAWATANGKWYYTTTPTPNAANKVSAPASGSAKTSAATAKTSKGTPVSTVGAKSGVAGASTSAGLEPTAAPIHPLTLAVVVGLALLYGGYEYRHDLANKLYKLRRNRSPRP
jgi:hypothetical protein